jgi:hypothetical protein
MAPSNPNASDNVTTTDKPLDLNKPAADPAVVPPAPAQESSSPELTGEKLTGSGTQQSEPEKLAGGTKAEVQTKPEPSDQTEAVAGLAGGEDLMPSAPSTNPADHRASRVQTLRSLVAAVLTRPQPVRHVVLETVPISEIDPQLPRLVELLARLRELPAEVTDLEGYKRVASDVHALWRFVFASTPPADQGMNQTLHALESSIAGMHILGTLAMRAVANSHSESPEMGPAQFDAIVDGHQTAELAKAGAATPHDLIPLVNAICDARRLLPARPDYQP